MNPITIEGNVTATPELKFGSSGKPFTHFTVASTSSRKDEQGQWQDEGTLFVRVTVFGKLAENTVQSVAKGQQVLVSGNLKGRDWVDKDGEKRTSIEMIGDKVGVSLRRQVCDVSKAAQGNSAPANQGYGGGGAGPQRDEQPPF